MQEMATRWFLWEIGPLENVPNIYIPLIRHTFYIVRSRLSEERSATSFGGESTEARRLFQRVMPL